LSNDYVNHNVSFLSRNSLNVQGFYSNRKSSQPHEKAAMEVKRLAHPSFSFPSPGAWANPSSKLHKAMLPTGEVTGFRRPGTLASHWNNLPNPKAVLADEASLRGSPKQGHCKVLSRPRRRQGGLPVP